jgi:hypothetical protein
VIKNMEGKTMNSGSATPFHYVDIEVLLSILAIKSLNTVTMKSIVSLRLSPPLAMATRK